MPTDLPEYELLPEPEDDRPRPRARRGGWVAAAVAAIAVVMLAVVATGQNDAPPAAQPGSGPGAALPSSSASPDAGAAAAPAAVSDDGFSVATTDGGTFAVPAGRPTVLFFLTTEGCASCIEEGGALNAIAERWGDRAAILGVEMVPGTPTEYIEYFAEYMGGLRYPIAVDDGQLVRRFGARTLDTTVVLDGQGREVFRDSVPTDEATLEEALTRAA